MNFLRLISLALLVAALPLTFAAAQSPANTEPPEQPGLTALFEPRVAELRAAGVKRITAGKSKRNVQILTQYGPAYFGWPKNVAPVAFEFYLNPDNQSAAFANDFNDATKAKFAAAVDALVPQVLRAAANAKAMAQRPHA